MPEMSIVAGREQERYYPYSSMFYANRHSFWDAGQDSWTLPPAQNQDAFMQLINAEPVLQGVLQRRRGYTVFGTTPIGAGPYKRSYSFRSEALGLRRVVFSGTTDVQVTDEQGNGVLNPLFLPSLGAQPPRMVLSRSYGYFADGIQADYVKWDGTANSPGNLTNWGININSIGSLVFGPQDATKAQDLGSGSGPGTSQGPLNCGTGTDQGGPVAWSNPGNIAVSGQQATSTLGSITTVSNYLRATNFGFSIPVNATITGIVVSYVRSASTNGEVFTNSLLIVQGGAAVGTDHAPAVYWGTTPQAESPGGSTDLWGVTWTPAQINASNFGFQLSAEQGTVGSSTASISAFPTVTVFYNVPATGSWTNPNGSFQNIPASPATTLTPSTTLVETGYGFSVPTARQVAGVQVAFSCKVSSGTVNLQASLLKNGLPTGTAKTTVVSSGAFSPTLLGSATDVWNGSFLPSDVNASNFGVQFSVTTATGTPTFSIDRVQITVFTIAGPLTFTTNTITTNIVLLNGRTYFYAFQNSKTGHTSSISPPSLSTGPLTGNQVAISNIPTCTDPQVDTVLLLATADGNDQTTLYQLAALPNGTATYNDTTPDALTASLSNVPALLTNSLYLNTDIFGIIHGIANNNPPPAINFPIKHKGRIYGSIGQTLYFSKNLDEVTTANGLITGKYEEAWPATNQFDVSEQAETITGLLSDGETLWIATERSIRRLVGDSPSNFQKPEVQFNEVGLLTQDCWRVVFFEGQPVGTMWVTPDLRVMASDFNTYQDVGTPIQDVLNSIVVANGQNIHASFVSKGPADYFMLYIPTPLGLGVIPDTVCVFDLRKKKWFIWRPSDGVSTSLFFIDATGSPRWLFATFPGPIPGPNNLIFMEWTSGTFADRINVGNGVGNVTYPVTMQTSWLDMGDYGLRKFVNQIIPTTGDNTALTVQVEAASNEQDFNIPLLVVPPTTVIPAAIPDDVFVPLASGPSHSRAFRFTFVSPPSTIQNVLTGYSIEAGVFHRY